jgi:competence protein ComEC
MAKVENSHKWGEESFFKSIDKRNKRMFDSISRLYDFSQHCGEIHWGTGSKATFSVVFSRVHKRSLFMVSNKGNLRLNVGWLDEGWSTQQDGVKKAFSDCVESIFDLKEPVDTKENWLPTLAYKQWGDKVDVFIQAVAKIAGIEIQPQQPEESVCEEVQPPAPTVSPVSVPAANQPPASPKKRRFASIPAQASNPSVGLQALLDSVKTFYKKHRVASIAFAILFALMLLGDLGNIAQALSNNTNLKPQEAVAAVSEQSAELLVGSDSICWNKDGSPIEVRIKAPDGSKSIVALSPGKNVSVGTEQGDYLVTLENDYFLMSDGTLLEAGDTQTVHLGTAKDQTLKIRLTPVDYAKADEAEATKWIDSAALYIENSGYTFKARKLKALALDLLSDAHFKAQPTGILRVHYIDVGQGDSAFIELPTGQTMLIDAGMESAGSTVVSYIKNLGYERIDFLVASHPHEDHIGGLPAVIKAFRVGEVWAPNVSQTTKIYEKFLDAVEQKDLKIHLAEKGKSIPVEGMTVDILSPANSSYSDLNDWSAIIRVTFNDNSFLFVGDASAAVTLNATKEHADVLKVGHHGSKTSTTTLLVEALSPTYAVISCGANNTYKHPDESTVIALASANLYRTDTQGTIIATSNGATITFNFEPVAAYTPPPPPQPEPQLEVAPAVSQPDPPQYTDVIVYTTNTGSKYHNDGCRYLSKSRIPISLSDAKARGLGPCSVCNPPR